MKDQSNNTRRHFLKKSGLSIPVLLSAGSAPAFAADKAPEASPAKAQETVNFVSDGLRFSPQQYVDKLQEISTTQGIERDFYGNGGAVQELERKFARLTGKEKAIFMPSGTMANELAIKLLNGHNTKVLVPENSHIYRDEADAAQSVHRQRLVPVGEGKPFFELEDLKQTLDYLDQGEVFRSGRGTISIENPVRRAEGAAVPLETLKEISTWARAEGYKLHLDGARIHLASAFTGVSLMEYASYFDTVYISLYKYLNAAGGAILCGDAEIIDQLPHQIKIHGGAVFQNWANAAVALHYLEGIEDRWARVVTTTNELMTGLNRIEGVNLEPLPHGTNVYALTLSDNINLRTLAIYLNEEHNMLLG
ncbi:MAG TPA: threonine aldolase, partial [Cytophagales bacterium]|nr:threonine aldolase [Cytophagales bacterium]